jgi:hypothetical protein
MISTGETAMSDAKISPDHARVVARALMIAADFIDRSKE